MSPFGLPYDQRWTPEQVQACVELFELSHLQRSQLLELKDRVFDLPDYWGNGPFELVRFVLEHTCHGNVDTMERRARQLVQWRTEHGLDTILETYSPPRTMYQFPTAVLQGTDKQGDCVVVVRQGDSLGLLQRYGVDEVLKGLFWGLEFTIRGPWQKEWVEKHRKRLTLGTAVVDLKGLNRRHCHPSLILLVQKLGGAIQLHYPHILKKVLIINAPTIFRFVWSIFKPFVFPHLRALMEVATEAETESLLQQYMDLEVLPEVICPGKGRGKPVPGLDPNWAIGLLPPPSTKDWDRIPLVYPPRKSFVQHQDTASTTSLQSSTNPDHSVCEEPHYNSRAVRTIAVKLLHGTWIEGMNATSVSIH